MQLRHHSASPVEETLRKALQLVDEETGIIRLLYEAPIAPDMARIFGCASLRRDYTMLGFHCENEVSGSTALTQNQAIVGAIGEAVERYSAAYVPQEDILIAAYESVAGDAVEPWSLVLYDDSQLARPDFGYRSVGPRDQIGWTEGYSLTRDKPILVPAFAVYQPYDRPNENPVVQQVTTGLACGNTREEAILAAVCEVVERDASMLMWMQSRRPPKVRASSDAPAVVAETFARFGSMSRYVTMLDITSDIAIPAFVAVWDGPIAGVNGAIFASCAKPDAGQAAAGALCELAQCMMWADSLISGGVPIPDPACQILDKIEEHVLWPLRKDNRKAFSFALESDRKAEWTPDTLAASGDVLDVLMRCVERVAAAGLEVIVVDVTSPDIADAGLHVFRAIIPGTQPLYFGSGLHRISPRARTCPYADRAVREINLHPHPFP